MDIDAPHEKEDFKPDLETLSDDEQEPDETMRLDYERLTTFWLTSLPAQILDAWSSISEPNVPLGKIVVYQMPDNSQVVRLFWQPSPNVEPIEYDLEMQEESVTNFVVITDKPKTNKPDERARTTQFQGAIEHLLEAQPRFDVDYTKHIKTRHDQAQRTQPVQILEDLGVSTSELRLLQAGRHRQTTQQLKEANKALHRQPKKEFERMTRMSRTDLLDALFAAFKEREFWSIKELRSRVQQPEVWLREVLNEIAVLERSGPNNGMYHLTENYGGSRGEDDGPDIELIEMKGEGLGMGMQPSTSGGYAQMYKVEPTQIPFDYGAPDINEEDDDDDDDDDEEMYDVVA